MKNKAKSKFPSLLLAVCVVAAVLLCVPTTVYAAPQIWEYYNTGEDNTYGVYGATWKAQTFTVGSTQHTVTSVKLLLYRAGSPGTVTVSIRTTDGSGHPSGGDLTSGTINGNTFTTDGAGLWYEIALTEYALSASTKYAIVVRAPSGNATDLVGWRCDLVDSVYGDGNIESSTDSGVSWSLGGGDFMFEVWGNIINVAPSIGSVSGTNWDDTDNCYAQKKTYTVTAVYTDLDGFADIWYCEMYIKTGELNTRAWFEFDEDYNSWSTIVGSSQWTLTGYSNVSSGNSITIVWGFQAQWDATEESDLDFYFNVADTANAQGDLLSEQNFDVVTRLITSGFTNDDSRINVAGTTTVSGTVYYGIDPGSNTASSSYPSDAEFTSVSVHSSAHAAQYTDTTIVNGAFSGSFAIPSAVQSNTYHAYVNLADADGTDQDAVDGDTTVVIGDRFEFVSVAVDDSRINVGGTFELRYQIRYDFDDVAFTSSKGSITGFVWDAGNSWWDKTVTGSSSVTSTNYDETYVAISDTTYGITAKQDVAGVNVITDRVEVYEKDDPVVSPSNPSDLIYSSNPVVGPQNWYALISSMFVPVLFFSVIVARIPRRVSKPKREWLALFLLVFLFGSCFLLSLSNVPTAHAAITRVQGNARGTTTTSTISVTMSSAPTSGNVLVATIATKGGPIVTVSSMSQTGVTWTYQVSMTQGASIDCEIWFGVIGAGASTSISIQLSGTVGQGGVADVCEYSGVLTSGFLDKTATASSGFSSNPLTGTTATTTEAVELWVGVTACGSAQSTPINGFTLFDGAVFTYTSNAYLEKIVSATGTANSGTTSSVGAYAGCIATFKAATGETTPPTYSNIAHNTTAAGNPALFSCQWTDNTGLSGHIFSTNNTGSWANDTWTSLSGNPAWANVTKTLNSTVGLIIGYQWFCNDTSNNWNSTTIQTLTTTDGSPPTYTTITVSGTGAGASVTFSSLWADNVDLSGFIFGFNNSGSWANDTWSSGFSGGWANVSKALNSTVGLVVGYTWWANDTSNNWNNTGTTTLTTTDISIPTYSLAQTNTTIAGMSCMFSVYWQDNSALSGFILSTNNTGSWANQTWTSLSTNPAWANKTLVLNTTVSLVVSYLWYCNDSSNNWATTTTYSLTTIYSSPSQYASVEYSTTIGGQSCLFSVYWTDDQALSGHIFGTNNTGSWVNETWASLAGAASWANVTKTLNITCGVRIEFEWWCNDSQNQWNDTGIQYLIVTNPTAPTYASISYSTANASALCDFSVYWTDNVELSGFIFSTNNTGSWINETWAVLSGSASWANVSKTLNSTIHLTVGYRWFCNDTGDNWGDTGINALYLLSSKTTSVPEGSYVVIWFRARYDYDNAAYTSASGSTLSINGTLATYDAGANYWWMNVTQAMDGNYTYLVSAVSDGVYGLTVFVDNIGSVIIEWTHPNNAPVTDGLEFVDPDNSTCVLASYRFYTFQVNVTDNDGPSDLVYVELRFEYSASNYTVKIQWLESMNTFTVTEGGAYIDEDESSNATVVNTTVLDFKVKFDWDYPLTTGVDAQVYAYDGYASDTDTFSLNITVVNTLTISGFNCDDDRGSTSQTLHFSGTIYYLDTVFSPSDSNITSVIIHDSSHNDQGSGATSSGFFNVTVTAKSSAGSTTYHVYMDGAGDYPDGDISGVTDSFIADNLQIFNIQAVQYLGSGDYGYECQIKYGFDSVLIENATVKVALPDGSDLDSLTSNSSGWVSLVAGQTNASLNGTYTFYGYNEPSYGVSASGANQTFALYQWTLATEDVDGSTLTGTSMNVTASSTPVWNGTATSVRVPADTFNVTITWLEDLVVNSTLNVNVGSDASTSFNCSCYPYLTGWAASNATISSATYASDVLTVNFSGAVDTYVLVASYPVCPTYILDFVYDLSTDFSKGYLVLNHYGNQTLQFGYASLGGVYLQMTTKSLISASFDNSLKKWSLTFNGTSGETGQAKVNCGARGNPGDTSGWSTVSYADPVLTGTYVLASPKTVTMQWKSTGSSGSSSSGSTQATSLVLSVSYEFPANVRRGETVQGTLNITWTGELKIFLWQIDCEYAISLTDVALPKELLIDPYGSGSTSLNVTLTVPLNATLNENYVLVDTTCNTVSSRTKTISNILTFAVNEPLAQPKMIPDVLVYAFLAGFVVIVGGGFFRSERARRRRLGVS